MKRWVVFVGIYCFMQGYTWSLGAQALVVKPIVSADLQQEREFFYQCWQQVYQEQKEQGLGVEQLFQFLAEMFDQEEEDYSSFSANRLFFHALQDGHIVGYISCCIKSQGVMHIRQLALASETRLEVMQALLTALLGDESGIACVHILLPYCAISYIDVLKNCGFQAAACGQLNWGVALQWPLRKCSTCMCDFDDDQSVPIGPYMFYEGVFPHDVVDLDEDDEA